MPGRKRLTVVDIAASRVGRRGAISVDRQCQSIDIVRAPGGRSAWSLAATLTTSPCGSLPSAIASPMVISMRKRMVPSEGWPSLWIGTRCCTFMAQHTTLTMLSHVIGSECPRFGRSARHVRRSPDRSRCAAAHEVVQWFRRHPARSGGFTQPCRHRRRRPASGPLVRPKVRCLGHGHSGQTCYCVGTTTISHHIMSPEANRYRGKPMSDLLVSGTPKRVGKPADKPACLNHIP